MNRRIALLFLVLSYSVLSFAQNETELFFEQEEVIKTEASEAELALIMEELDKVHHLSYYSNLDTALAEISTNYKHIMMIFSGSDWCRPCQVLKKEILEEQSFMQYADDNLVIVYLDFPAKKENKLSDEQQAYNDALAEEFNPYGFFPSIFMMDKNRELLGEIDYRTQTAQAFIELCKELTEQ